VAFYGELRWQPDRSLLEAYGAVVEALRGDRVGLGDVLEAWRYVDALEAELVDRGLVSDPAKQAETGGAMCDDGRGTLRLWFRDEIENGLTGVFAAMASASAAEGSDYRRGFVDALRAVGLVFGVRVGDPARAITGDRGRLVE